MNTTAPYCFSLSVSLLFIPLLQNNVKVAIDVGGPIESPDQSKPETVFLITSTPVPVSKDQCILTTVFLITATPGQSATVFLVTAT
ncbi:hypothetical protein AB205_0208220 [Aquarana catesbeiana]|uniref:Secreted protein n=1 Tax=Aquarana catesbeiana TaxID=8400 RepID=A0A2G9RKN8_AQUCT|nr:hypothetical protein AB205_0208220 [Aquarana catesbeiana]